MTKKISLTLTTTCYKLTYESITISGPNVESHFICNDCTDQRQDKAGADWMMTKE